MPLQTSTSGGDDMQHGLAVEHACPYAAQDVEQVPPTQARPTPQHVAAVQL